MLARLKEGLEGDPALYTHAHRSTHSTKIFRSYSTGFLSLDFTNGQGVDVIYDSVGRSTFIKGIKVLKKKGRIVSFGFSSGKIEPIDINKLRPISGSIATGGLLTYISNPKEMQKNADQLFNLINQNLV